VHFVNTGELRGVLKGHPMRQGLKSDLEGDFALLAKRAALPAASLKRLDKEGFGVSIRRYQTDPADRIPYLYFNFKTVAAIASFQTLEIYQAQLASGFPGDICRCRACDSFFFSSDVSKATGRKRSDFCSLECETDYQRTTGADRKAASRRGIPVAEWRRQKAAEEAKK
jgi:hypothetical protein